MRRSWFWQGMLAAVIVVPALADASRAQADCSDATSSANTLLVSPPTSPPTHERLTRTDFKSS